MDAKFGENNLLDELLVSKKGDSVEHEAEISPEMQQCIESCLQCYQSCTQLIPHCLQMGGKHAEAAHIQTLATCAEICQTSAHMMMWDSSFHHKMCGICAEICQVCAADCERLAGEDQMMLDCAKRCRECEKTCSAMATHH